VVIDSFVIADAVEILEAAGMVADRSGSLRSVRSQNGWTEAVLYRGAGDRIHVVLSVVPGPDGVQVVGAAAPEVRAELVVDAGLGATRLARTILAAAGLDAEGRLD
jgi:hypothetical protein